MKYIKKSSFKSAYDLNFTINYLSSKECKNTVRVDNQTYHALKISGSIK